MTTLRKFLDNCNIDADVAYDEPMSRHTTFRIGGPADAFVKPWNADAFSALLKAARNAGVPVAIIGGGANLLVADRGVRGIVASTEALRHTRLTGEGALYAGAGVPVVELVHLALREGRSGLEFAAGLPGSVGGAVYMNARCYEHEFADVLAQVDFIEPAEFSPVSMNVDRDGWAYKSTPFMAGGSLAGGLITGATFSLVTGDREGIAGRMSELEADRTAKGHFDFPSAGSLFKNNRAFGKPTGKILDELGFRNRRIGDAMVSPKHANIFINAGRASAADMLALIEEAQSTARRAFGVELEPEVVRLGDF
jgi:UDP-N-acetylmuramate dehydrogenase